MSKNELITVPDELKAVTKQYQDVSPQSVIDVPAYMKVEVLAPEAMAVVEAIEQVPFDIEVYQLPRTKLGEMAVQELINVPSSTGAATIEPGTPLNGPREKEVIGGLSEFKGGNPRGVIGYDGDDNVTR